MAWLLIFLLTIFILFYFVTRIVWVRIIKGDIFKAEIHLPIFAIHLIKSDDSGDNKKQPDKQQDKPSALGYIRIITGIVEKIKDSKIEVKRVIIPIKTDNFNKSAILRPIRQHAFICAFIAYLRTKTEKLIIEDNAITLSPDIGVIHFYITIKLRLYQLIQALIWIWHSINEERKRNKGDRRNVRE